MAINNNYTEQFLNVLNELELVLKNDLFKKQKITQKGYAVYAEYRRPNKTMLEFMFGPVNWDIEIIIITANGKFTFKDLLNFSEINNWVNSNRYIQIGNRNIKKEMSWYIELIKIALPILE